MNNRPDTIKHTRVEYVTHDDGDVSVYTAFGQARFLASAEGSVNGWKAVYNVWVSAYDAERYAHAENGAVKFFDTCDEALAVAIEKCQPC